MDNITKYYRKIEDIIHEIITNDLTIGREEEDLIPFTTDEIKQFIDSNTTKIDNVIRQIITEYERDGDLDELDNPEYDWISEYLYDVVNTFA